MAIVRLALLSSGKQVRSSDDSEGFSPNNSSEEREIASKLLSEGPLLALGSALAYLVAYIYEAGFLRYFGAPLDLIQVDGRIIARAVFVLMVIATLPVQILVAYLHLRADELSQSSVVSVHRKWMVLNLFVTSTLTAMGYGVGYVLLAAVTITVFVSIVVDLFIRRHRPGLVSEWEARPSAALMIAAIYMIAGAWTLGLFSARTEETFMQLSSGAVVLRVYGDRAITMERNGDTELLQPVYGVQPLSQTMELRPVPACYEGDRSLEPCPRTDVKSIQPGKEVGNTTQVPSTHTGPSIGRAP